MNFKRLAISAFLILVVGVSIGASISIPDLLNNSPRVVQDSEKTAKVVLKAPDKAKVGQLVVLDVSESVATSFRWEARTKTNNFLVIEGGKRAVFSSETAGEFTFVVAVAKADTVDVVIHTVKISGGGPPAPTDDLNTRVASWCETVESPTKRDDALKLSQSFSSLSTVIKSEMTADEIIDATKESNRAALGDNLKHWTPFLDGLGSEMTKLSAAGQLNDAEAHKRVWKAIGEALAEYAKTL